MKLHPRARGWLRGATAATLALLGAAAMTPLPARLAAPASPVLAWRDGTAAHVALAPDDRWRIAARLEAIDPALVDALQRVEDARSAWHPGVDPIAVGRAALSNLLAGHTVSGASTLDMQVIRMVEPRPRTLRSKLIEAGRALSLRAHLGHRAVLEAWLTFAPYGGNVEGVEAASWMLFGHDARHLSAEEVCALLAIPQEPNARRPSLAHEPPLRAARDRVARYLDAHGGLPGGAALDEVLAAEVPTAAQGLPREVPHQASRAPAVSTLDRGTQRTVERVVGRHRAPLQDQAIYNVAVLVTDLATAEVRAALGGFDWWDADHAGTFDALNVPRSPGSALKPWVYALSIDAGLALPETLVPDVPTRYGGWIVDNYDGTWSGAVRLEDALSRSLNIPFVDLLAGLGAESFISALRACGVRSLVETPGHYGLSAAVGGVEITPAELAVVYGAVGLDGRCRALKWERDAPSAAPTPALSPGAAWLTRRALRLRDRPDVPSRRDLGGLPRGIAWKTGTSQGHHDAWSVGTDGGWLAVVWLGNLDQRASHALVGSEVAAPILFDVLEALGATEHDDPAPPDLTPVELCALTGHLPGEACPRRERALAPSTVPPERCPYHSLVEIDDSTGMAVLPACAAGRSTHPEAFVTWPAAIERLLVDRGEDLPRRPPLAPGCAERSAGPRIVSPAPGQKNLLLPSRSVEDQQIPLIADAAGGRVAWFVDGVFLGEDEHGRAWWTPSLGAHEAVAVDRDGRAAHVRFTVSAPR